MKRAFPQNPKSVSNPFLNIPLDGVEQDVLGNHCRFKTSAAVLGLALSVGASGTFLAHPGVALATVIPKNALALASATSSDKFSGALSSQGSVANVFHTVEEGETVWEIALSHQVDVQDIKAANGIAPGEVLKVGQVLRVPAETQVTAVSTAAAEPVAAPQPATASAKPVDVAFVQDSVRERRQSDLSSAGSHDSVSDSLSETAASQATGSQAENLASAPPLTLPLNPEFSEAAPSVPSVGLESVPQLDAPSASTPQASLDTSLASVPESAWSDRSVVSTPGTDLQELPASPTVLESAADAASAEAAGEDVIPQLPLASTQADPQKPQQLAALGSVTGEPNIVDETLPDSPFLYQVRPGDSVWEIASAHGVSPEKLVQQNPELSDPNVIHAGQSLRLPSASAIAVRQPTRVDAESRAIDLTESSDHILRIREAAANPVDREQLYAWIQSAQQRAASAGSVENIPQPAAEAPPGQGGASMAESAEALITPEQQPSQDTAASTAATVASEASEAETQDPHVASLISEIRQLQRQQPVDVAVLAPPAVSQPEVAEDAPVNPEFSPDIDDQDAEATLQRERLMAAAPLSSEAYMPRPVVPVGQTVSPELPILPQPGEFLPEAPNRFDGYIWPAQGVLTSGYGWRWGRMHHGVDVAGPVGTPIFASASGVVVRAGWNSGGYGNLVDIRHPDGSLTRYAHNSRLNVRQGQEVRQGQQIAEMGSTGYSTGPHLHFEIHIPNSGTVNPMAHLPNR